MFDFIDFYLELSCRSGGTRENEDWELSAGSLLFSSEMKGKRFGQHPSIAEASRKDGQE